MAAKKGANIFVWILLGLLIVGLAGFGIGNFGGTTRTVGSVGTAEITVDDYARAFDDERRRVAAETGTMPAIPDALADGMGDRVLARLVIAAALENEATRIGLSVGDATLRRELRAAPVFAGPEGGFDRDAYALWLDNRGMTADAFEADLRADLARGLLLDAVAGGVRPRPAYADLLLSLIAERRDIAWAPVAADLLDAPVPAPTEDQIAAWYRDNAAAYTAPETRGVTFAALTPEAMIATMAVDEATLRDAYAARADRYDIPERRLVERLVFPDAAAARAARDRLATGAADFAALAAERGLEPADIDLGEVRRGDLAPAAAEAVFGLAEPGVAGPVDSALGPALFRVNAILARRVTPFEDARDELARELLADRAEREIAGASEELADLLAGGATLEDLAAETAMTLGTARLAAGEPASGIAADPALRAAAETAEPGDFPELQPLDGGGVFALRVDAVDPPALQPLDAVRDRVAADWRAAETARRLAERAAALRDRLAAGADWAALGLTPRTIADATRDATPPGAPPGLVAAAFAAPAGAAGLVPGPVPALFRVTAVTPPDPDDPMLAALSDALGQAGAQGRADDIARLFAEAARAGAETRLDRTAIDAVNAQLR